jgi:hypothetical protein
MVGAVRFELTTLCSQNRSLPPMEICWNRVEISGFD